MDYEPPAPLPGHQSLWHDNALYGEPPADAPAQPGWLQGALLRPGEHPELDAVAAEADRALEELLGSGQSAVQARTAAGATAGC